MVFFETKDCQYQIVREGPEEVIYQDNKRLGVVFKAKGIAEGEKAVIDYYREDTKRNQDLWTITTDIIRRVKKW